MSDQPVNDHPAAETEPERKFWQSDGIWAATTLGEFTSLLIDGGNDQVFMRVVEIGPNDEKGNFTLKLEVHLVPNGHVLEHAAAIGCQEFNTRLIAAIERGLVK